MHGQTGFQYTPHPHTPPISWGEGGGRGRKVEGMIIWRKQQSNHREIYKYSGSGNRIFKLINFRSSCRPTFLDFLIMGWGLSSSSVKLQEVGSNMLWPAGQNVCVHHWTKHFRRFTHKFVRSCFFLSGVSCHFRQVNLSSVGKMCFIN